VLVLLIRISLSQYFPQAVQCSLLLPWQRKIDVSLESASGPRENVSPFILESQRNFCSVQRSHDGLEEIITKLLIVGS
jgi:hypothetical protein